MRPTLRCTTAAATLSIAMAAGAAAQAPAPAAQPSPDAEMTQFIDNLLSQMTLEEKCGQLSQAAGHWNNTGPAVSQGGVDEIRAGEVGSFLSVYGANLTRELQRVAVEETRLGIPMLFAHDVIHGFRTIFPVPLAMASSWDPEAHEQAARIAATEATAAGVHWTYAPMVDIARDPRWGRVVEGSGEDPYLTSVLAAASVRGFQGNDLSRSDTLLACAKHYAAYGTAEGGRDYNSGELSDRTLREVYLPPFHACVDAGVTTFMSGFNDIGGVPSHANPYLLRDILRGEWGFEGVVVSDYTGIEELLDHGVAGTRIDAGLLALRAGVDIDMLSDIYLKLPQAVRDGQLDESIIDEAVRRVLELKYRLGLFEDPYRYSDEQREAAAMLTPENRATARRIAHKSMVLLKNERHTLPFSKQIRSLAVIGPLADDPHSCLGNWTAAGRVEDAITILEGLRAKLPGVAIHYAKGCEINSPDTSGFDAAVRAARDADAVVLVIGEHRDMSAEAKSRASIDLPGVQRQLAEAILGAGKPLAVVLMNGRPLNVTWLDENVHAILETWFLGVEMGPAVADVLFGDVNPSGKLPLSFPRSVGQVPIYYNQRNTGRPPDPSDPYTLHYIDSPWTPLYVFGHGLSYTDFTYSQPRVSAQEIAMGESIDVSIDLTNSGDRAGEEVVQLYIRDLVGSTARPIRELKAFRRVNLQPGQTRTIEFTLAPADLAVLGPDNEWRVEPGDFQVFVGGSSATTLQAAFTVVQSPQTDRPAQ